MSVEIKTNTRHYRHERMDNKVTEWDAHTVEIWINGVKYTTDAPTREDAQRLVVDAARALGLDATDGAP